MGRLARGSGPALPILVVMVGLASCRAKPPETPAPDEVRDAVYFILVDRYANGDPSNDGMTEPHNPAGWHGGDLAGVRAHLDDLQDLGIGTVWLSPITASRQEPLGEWGAFHGYWVDDPSTIEPRFGSTEEARGLVDAMHERGMRLLLDTIWNHVGYDADLTRTHPEWFHGLGNIEDWDDPVQVEAHDVHGLPDLDQEQRSVRAYLESSTFGWIERLGADGLRVDAVRHLPSPFIRGMSTQLESRYGPSFALLGEHFEGDPYLLDERQKTDGLTSVFDFPMHYAMADVFCRGAHSGALASVLSADHTYEGRSHATEWLEPRVTFLDNHDTPRIASTCGGDLDRVARALAFQLTTRGTPALYMGTEQGMTGEEEPENRADMVFGPHPLKDLTRELLGLRARSVSLRKGRTRLEHIDDDLLVYSRITDQESSLIIANQAAAAVTFPRPEDFPKVAAEAYQVRGVGTMDTPPHETLLAPGHSVSVWIYRGAMAGPLAARAAARTRTRQVTLIGSGLPLGEGDRAAWVGADPELGQWIPERGIPAVASKGQVSAQVTLTEDRVLNGKWIVLSAEGDVIWQPGPNTYSLVRDLPSEVTVEWPGG